MIKKTIIVFFILLFLFNISFSQRIINAYVCPPYVSALTDPTIHLAVQFYGNCGGIESYAYRIDHKLINVYINYKKIPPGTKCTNYKYEEGINIKIPHLNVGDYKVVVNRSDSVISFHVDETANSIDSTVDCTDNVYMFPENWAEFPGGEKKMLEYMQKEMQYSEEEKRKGVSGTAIVSFIIDKAGKINNIKLASSIPKGEGCNNEALRIVKSMPPWNPAKENGEPVRMVYTLPIRFSCKKIDTTVANYGAKKYFEQHRVKSGCDAGDIRITCKQNLSDGYYIFNDKKTRKKRQEGLIENGKKNGLWTYYEFWTSDTDLHGYSTEEYVNGVKYKNGAYRNNGTLHWINIYDKYGTQIGSQQFKE